MLVKLQVHHDPSMSIQHSETNFRCFQCFPPSFLFGYFLSHWFFAKKLWKAHLVDGVLKASTPIGRIGTSIDLQPVPQAKGRYSTGANGYMACTTCLKCKDFDVQFTSNTVKWNSKEECADMSQHGSHEFQNVVANRLTLRHMLGKERFALAGSFQNDCWYPLMNVN